MSNAPVDFLVGSVVAIVSAGIGYFGAFLQRLRDDKRRRASIATILLIELGWLESALRRVYNDKTAAFAGVRFTTEAYDRHEGDLLLFDPHLARSLANFRGLLRDIEVSWIQVRASETPPGPEQHHFFRVKAGFAARMIPRLKQQLEGAGGVIANDSTYEAVDYQSLPELPPPAFGRKTLLTHKKL